PPAPRPILRPWRHPGGPARAARRGGLAARPGSVLRAGLGPRAGAPPVRRPPWRGARPWRALTAIALSAALVVGTTGGWWAVLHRTAPAPPVADAPSLATDEVATVAPPDVRPYGWQLGSQWPDLPERCGGPWKPEEGFRHVNCQQLLAADADPSGTVVVVGSSHSRQFIPALIPWAEQNDLQIVNLSMDGCAYLAGTERAPYCAGYD